MDILCNLYLIVLIGWLTKCRKKSNEKVAHQGMKEKLK